MKELVRLYLWEYLINKISLETFEKITGIKINESDISEIKDKYKIIRERVGKQDYGRMNFDVDCRYLLDKYTDIILNKL